MLILANSVKPAMFVYIIIFYSEPGLLIRHTHGTVEPLFVYEQVGPEQTIYQFYAFFSHVFCLLCQRNDL